ncbi:TPA: glycoside hydrolase family 13 protein [Enterococcus faecium]|uniref:glycoside hydrolase family 13 protein n=1 Tax=unclassified Enterococcus TaxID=2608891 RepID=UPI00280E93EE|nr:MULTISPECIES: glycoside hydrolase family 13 protein [unclassified Enterococcus]MDQ8605467.1 glycoside hydrolase family 13 protein [Enterococcus sp. FR202]MDQ8628468.1 glycoside hydrolase family 13 protein [Enterococcus sp. FR204]MDQ8647559.1 glycoside hydrolase family 13 protein [Enterococcus sp. FR208]MDQ8660021.1 glycoside hydrolase family 13 protein [Enterococcus sp. FR205]MDQ8667847.1 glycoside hydrolase family 13 protein [Enterococcus sp. FR203]
MDTAATYHRPESEYAFLYTNTRFRIRLRTRKNDIKKVYVLCGDPYTITTEKWYQKQRPMKKCLSTNVHDYWEIEVTRETRRLQYAFHVVGEDNTDCFYGDQGIFPYRENVITEPNFYFRIPYFHQIDRFTIPEWVKETVWYQIFPERFANGDKANDPEHTLPWGSKDPDREDFFGGDLQGVMDHLDYLTDLGINGIYFCPIFKATSNHKYDTIDYYEVDPAFGDKKLLKNLIDEAHKRGIRIMFDAVFNHMGVHSPQWQDVLKNGEKSIYKDWFHIRFFPVDSYQMTDLPETAENIPYDTFAFTPFMPKLNTANPEVQKYLLDIATYWIKEFDIDGWRLDVANEVDHHFWKKFREAVTEIKPDIYILGEIWHSSQAWLQGDEFHAVMNYAFTDSIKDYFAKKKITASQMVSGMNHQQMLYRDQVNEGTFNLLDSHDTARILTLCQGNKELMKSVMAFMFLQKGSPCIYYGTEIGMTGEDDPDCRKCMIWEKEEQDLELFGFIKELVSLRKQLSKIISEGSTQWLIVNDREDKLYFTRELEGQIIYVYFNQSKEPWVVEQENEVILSQNCQLLEDGKAEIRQYGFLIMC